MSFGAIRTHTLGEVRGLIVEVEAHEPMPRFVVRVRSLSDDLPMLEPVQARALAALLHTAAGFIEKGRP